MPTNKTTSVNSQIEMFEGETRPNPEPYTEEFRKYLREQRELLREAGLLPMDPPEEPQQQPPPPPEPLPSE